MAVHQRLTPAGDQITFEDGLRDPETGKAKRRTYWLNGATPDKVVPSITTVTKVMEKEPLHYAIQKLVVRGAITLVTSTGLPTDFDDAMQAFKDRGLDFDAQWGRRAKKGTDTHAWFERLLIEGEGGVPEDCEPFVAGIMAWRDLYLPAPIQSEAMVCSTTHRFAGRFDLLATLPSLEADCRIELKTTESLPRRKSGEVYPPYTEHLWQLAAQELAAVESGDPPSQLQGVLRVDEQGEYDFYVTQVEPRGFLAALALYRALRGIPEPNQQLTMEAA